MSIEKHEFADDKAGIKAKEIDCETVVLEFGGQWIFLDRDDVIALAKHFNLKVVLKVVDLQ